MSFIRRLYADDRDQWIYEFFPEYAELFGGYPSSIKRAYGRITGSAGLVPERTPWQGWMSGAGVIMASGIRWGAPPMDPNVRAPGFPLAYHDVPEDEYRAWCDRCNWYRNGGRTPLGGPGLDPALVLEGVDDRSGADYWQRLARYRAEKLLVKPNFITCPGGVYLPMRGPGGGNPWGVNSAFIANGERTPLYVSDKWGPAHFDPPPWIGKPAKVPDQADYDRERWSVYL